MKVQPECNEIKPRHFNFSLVKLLCTFLCYHLSQTHLFAIVLRWSIHGHAFKNPDLLLITPPKSSSLRLIKHWGTMLVGLTGMPQLKVKLKRWKSSTPTQAHSTLTYKPHKSHDRTLIDGPNMKLSWDLRHQMPDLEGRYVSRFSCSLINRTPSCSWLPYWDCVTENV